MGVAVTPDGKKVYVANENSVTGVPGSVSVIDTATNTVTSTITVGHQPFGVAIAPNGKKVYVTNLFPQRQSGQRDGDRHSYEFGRNYPHLWLAGGSGSDPR